MDDLTWYGVLRLLRVVYGWDGRNAGDPRDSCGLRVVLELGLAGIRFIPHPTRGATAQMGHPWIIEAEKLDLALQPKRLEIWTG